jgi:hypothetical protein
VQSPVQVRGSKLVSSDEANRAGTSESPARLGSLVLDRWISLDSSVREFATHAAELEFGERRFQFGGVRIGFTSNQTRQGFARLSRQIDITKANLTENFDKLSDFLNQDDVQSVNAVLEQLTQAFSRFPGNYGSLILDGRQGVAALRNFLNDIGESHGFHV